jgi:hypothetical protein
MALSTAGSQRPLMLAVLLTAGLLMARTWLASGLGYADAEALYAVYAAYPQPAYLDHPGLVGTFTRALGGGDIPSPRAMHWAAIVGATVLPWWGLLAARLTGARGPLAFRTFFALALAPELAIGLFAINPDLLLAYGWLATLGLAGFALRREAGSTAALASILAAAGLAALSTLAKVSGALLFGVLVWTLFAPSNRRHLKTIAPYAAAIVSLVLLAPLLVWEHSQGYPMLRHRLVATQSEAGFSLRNAFALVGGQLLYVTPPLLVAAYRVLRWLGKAEGRIPRLLFTATWLPAAALGVLCLWSRVAEPHWIAPSYLGLALGAAHGPALGKGLIRAIVGVGLGVIALSALWVGTSLPPTLLGRYYEGRYDLANDLFAWGPGRDLVRGAVEDVRRETGMPPVVVGPHWIVCAQARAALGPRAPVGCRTPTGDDFQSSWLPDRLWLDDPVVLYVSDDRFQQIPSAEFPDRLPRWSRTVDVERGRIVVRTLTVTRLDLAEASARRSQ